MKLAVLLLFVGWQLNAQSSLEIFASGNFKGAKNASGEVIIPPVHDDLGWSNNTSQSSNQLIGYKEGSNWGLMSLDNKKITQARYAKIEPFFSNLFRVAIKGKFTNRYFYGLINEKGKIVLNLDYFDLDHDRGTVLTTTYENNQFLIGARNQNLDIIIPQEYLEIDMFGQLLIGKHQTMKFDVYTTDGGLLESGLHATKKDQNFLITTRNGKDGLISSTGDVIHSPIHKKIKSHNRIVSFPKWEIQIKSEKYEINCDSLSYLSKHFWVVHTNGTSQLFSEELAHSEHSYQLKQIEDDHAILRSLISNKWLAISPGGNELLTNSDSIHFNGKYFFSRTSDKWTIHDRFGKQITGKAFDSVLPQENRYQPVKRFNYWAILDGIQASITDFRYDSISDVIGSKLIVKYVKKWGVYQIGTGWLIHPNFDQIVFSNDHFLGRIGRSHHLLNEKGQLLFKTIDRIQSSNDHFVLEYEGKYSILNKHGRPVANTEYNMVQKWGEFYEMNLEFVDLYNSYGTKILRQKDQVEDILGYSDNYFLIKKNGNFGFIDELGNLRVANRYDSAMIFSEELAPIKLRGKWGYIDKSERIIIQPHYQWVSSFDNGIALFKSNGHYGILNTSGQEILPPKYSRITKTTYGNFLLVSKQGYYSLANSSGITFLSGSYDSLVDVGNSMVIGSLAGKKGILDYNGRTIANFDYDEIEITDQYILLRKN